MLSDYPDIAIRFDVPMGGEYDVAPYLAAVFPDGHHCTMDDARSACKLCKEFVFQYVYRTVEVPSQAKDAPPQRIKDFATICPRCMILRADGKNLFGRAETRVHLGWLDRETGVLTLDRVDDERGE